MICSKLLSRSLFFCSLLLITTGAVSCPSTLIFDDKTEICLTDLDQSILDLPCKYCPKDSTFRSAISRSGSNGVSFAISEDKENPSWGISGARWITPASADQQAIERCKNLENKISPNKNKSNCKLLISAVAPVGKVTSGFSRKDFFEKLNIFSVSIGGNLSGANRAKKDHPIAEGAEIATNGNPKIIAANDQLAAAPKKDRSDIDRERQQLAEERRRLEEDKRQREQQRRNERVNLQVTHTQPNTDGSFTINVQTNADTSSLRINGEEQGGRANGDYIVRKVARAGQETKFIIIATDINGNTDTKTITVSRAIVDSKITYAALNPGRVKQQSTRDAIAIIIGIADYKSLPRADFANDDARAFYDYAMRALGVKPENIKLLVDGDADEAEILRTFRNWLPSKVKSTTEVYVFYSGHGLPTADGQGLYLIPPRAAKDVIDDTAIPFSKINAAIQSAKPKSVTMILDACYSGQARSGESLVASARPVQLKTENRLFPENFTVITASQNDQISSSNPDLQHGIFSYYLMKGMEGDADANEDGKITLGEMQAYLVENVGRQAGMMSRKQEPQLVGDANRVLVGR
jgi:hypothetical protein